eukprot:TRINITY_DN6256_c0_g1_i1.p1 TRINITY_DN6256_c0_g1~~TRINITY_DN6256_c0_g1_i1.p1  ORF type:complete len:656 (+),score=144.05 TRINITY_DN6256_c0_g1_i1:147-2114(+)
MLSLLPVVIALSWVRPAESLEQARHPHTIASGLSLPLEVNANGDVARHKGNSAPTKLQLSSQTSKESPAGPRESAQRIVEVSAHGASRTPGNGETEPSFFQEDSELGDGNDDDNQIEEHGRSAEAAKDKAADARETYDVDSPAAIFQRVEEKIEAEETSQGSLPSSDIYEDSPAAIFQRVEENIEAEETSKGSLPSLDTHKVHSDLVANPSLEVGNIQEEGSGDGNAPHGSTSSSATLTEDSKLMDDASASRHPSASSLEEKAKDASSKTTGSSTSSLMRKEAKHKAHHAPSLDSIPHPSSSKANSSLLNFSLLCIMFLCTLLACYKALRMASTLSSARSELLLGASTSSADHQGTLPHCASPRRARNNSSATGTSSSSSSSSSFDGGGIQNEVSAMPLMDAKELEKLLPASSSYDCAFSKPTSTRKLVRLQVKVEGPDADSSPLIAPLTKRPCVLYSAFASRRLHDGMHPVPVAYSSESHRFKASMLGAPEILIEISGEEVSLFETKDGQFNQVTPFPCAPDHWQDFVSENKSAGGGFATAGNQRLDWELRSQGTAVEFQECALVVGAVVTVVGELCRSSDGNLHMQPLQKKQELWQRTSWERNGCNEENSGTEGNSSALSAVPMPSKPTSSSLLEAKQKVLVSDSPELLSVGQ